MKPRQRKMEKMPKPNLAPVEPAPKPVRSVSVLLDASLVDRVRAECQRRNITLVAFYTAAAEAALKGGR